MSLNPADTPVITSALEVERAFQFSGTELAMVEVVSKHEIAYDKIFKFDCFNR